MKHWFFGGDLWKSRFGMMAATCFLTLMWFVVDWCMGTTFRAMSIWELWVNNILAALVLLLPFVISRRVSIQIFFLVIVDMILMANLMYSRTYFTGIPFESYMLAGNLKDFMASVVDSLRWRDLGFPVILIAGAVLAIRMPGGKSIIRLWLRYITLLLVPAVVSIIGNTIKGGFYNAYDSLGRVAYTNSCGVPVYTVAGHALFTAMDSGKGAVKADEAHKIIAEWIDTHQSVSAPVSLPDSVKPKKNLVVVLLESFESWPIGKEVEGMEITPYINSLVADSTTFYAPYALTQVDCGRSIDGQLLITAGLLPTKGVVYSTRFPNSTYLTLNKALKEKYGAESLLLTVDQLITWNMGVIASSFGYDRILERSTWDNDEKVGASRKLSDGSFFRQSVDKIREENLWRPGEHKMLTFVTYSGHNPFILPDFLRDPKFDLRDKGFDTTVENYLTMAHYTDSHLHTIIDYLRSRPDWDETMVLITGDHEGLAAQRQEILKSGRKGSELVSAGQYTPFIVVNSPVDMKYDKVFGQVDIYPTLLTMLGLQDYKWQGIGQSLLAVDKIPAAISSMTGVVDGDISSVDSLRLKNWKESRDISDAIIRYDYLDTVAKE
ncbi:MAG: LTA synthase family protein [Duncaniella sp.]|nr:LTA synthase family protein [Duncaniella sp.]